VKIKVQIVQDSVADTELVLNELRRAGFDPEWKRVETESEYLAQLDQGWEIILAGYNLPEFNGLRALQLLREREPDLPFIFVSGAIGEDKVVEAMKAGANNYIRKDQLSCLGLAVERELYDAKEQRKRKQMAEAQCQSEKRNCAVSRLSSDFAYSCIHAGDDGYVMDWITDAFFTLTGYSDAELREQRCWLFVSHPDDRKMATQPLHELKAGESDTREFRIVTKDGRLLYIMSHMECQIDPKAHGGLRLFGTVQDITRRKQAEGKLAESERRFRQLSELLPQLVFETDISGNLTFSNLNGIKSLGYSLEEFQAGINIFALISPEDREKIKTRLKEILSGSETAPREFQLIRKDGGKFPILMHADAILEGGVPIGVRGIAFDITDRKRAEEELRESEEKYRTLVENAAEVILIAQDGMLKFVNSVASEITGYSNQELRSSPFLEFIHPDDRNMVGESYLKRLKGNMLLPRYEFRLICKDGSIKWVEITAVKVAWEGKPATLNFLSDITERKGAEENLAETFGSLRTAIGGIIQVLSSITEKRDPYTAGHQRRVADLARAIGQEMGLTANRVEGLQMAGMIHDIGKVSVPAEILSKPTLLTEIEYKLIQTHSQVGYDIIKTIDFSWPIAEMILQHHERINGSGYPNRLKGEEILVEARILAVSDIVEAMAFDRPYRPAQGIEAALEEIEKNKGILYDPDVVSACLTLFREKSFEFKL